MEGLDAYEDAARSIEAMSDVAKHPVDCIYVAASAHDTRYTRICVASIRYFYPDIPIRLLVGGSLERALTRELRRYWAVETVELPARNYGWGFVKLEPLFGPPGERFLVLDSDTVLAGPILETRAQSDAPFLVDDESQSESDIKRLYYDWEELRAIDPSAQPPRFVFNSGQWFGTAGVLTRDDFAPWVNWTMPRALRYPERFMPGDQGVLNYILNQKAALDGLQVERRKILRWPGHGLLGLDVETIAKGSSPPLVVHWAGMKEARLRSMTGGDLLTFFDKAYYKRLPASYVRRRLGGARHVLSAWLRGAHVWLTLASRRLGHPARTSCKRIETTLMKRPSS